MLNKQKDSHSKNDLNANDRELFKQLFVNREDDYAYQKADGNYNRAKSPLTDDILFGDQTVGTYNLDRSSNVINACLDFDIDKKIHETKDSMSADEWDQWIQTVKQHTKSCFAYLQSLDIPCYPEFSGYKGYHIWFFLDKPMPAADVRRWIQHIRALLPAMPKDLALELFPKQDKISADGYGNFVKFPLQVNRKSGKCSYFLDEDFNPIVGLPEITRTGLVELPKLPEEPKKPRKAFKTYQGSSNPDLALEKLPVVIENCAYMQKLLKRIEEEQHLEHAERIWLANILKPFGNDIVHEYFSKLSDYDAEYTDQQLNSLGGLPSVCSSSPMCAVERCPLMQEIGKESPIAFAYRVLTHNEIDPRKPWVFFNAKAQRHHYLYDGEQYGIPKEELKTLYSNFGMKAPKRQKILFPKFDPHDPWHIDLMKRTINYFQPSEYMKLGRNDATLVPTKDFPTIWQLLGNVMPVEDEKNHFVNWLATIFNTKKKLRTSFVFKGAQGAGKNAMFEHILAPLFGRNQCRVVKNEDLEERFNPYMRGAFFLAFDEVAHDNKSRNRLNSKLKALITDDKVTLNDKNDKAYEIENRMNCVFFSNEAVPLVVEQSDRRFTVVRTGGNLATRDLFTGDKFFERIKAELLPFSQYLKNFPYDENQANTALDTSEKRNLAAAAMDRYEEFASKLKANDGEWLKGANDNFLYSPSFDDDLSGNIRRSEAKDLFKAIYGGEISTQALTKKLAVHGIECKKRNGEYIYVW